MSEPPTGLTFRAMEAEQLVRHLRRLKRSLEQLESEFARQHVDQGLLVEIDRMVDEGLTYDTRLTRLVHLLERLRENTLTPRVELYSDGVRDCRRAKAIIEELMAVVG
jgi:hypothetical protein